jgi:hypothetical protein
LVDAGSTTRLLYQAALYAAAKLVTVMWKRNAMAFRNHAPTTVFFLPQRFAVQQLIFAILRKRATAKPRSARMIL